jgi:methylenetetrahydrofolate reductase (NADPH)
VRIADMYRAGRIVYSFEFFPPHGPVGAAALLRTLDELRRLQPDFVSVTYPLDRARRHLTLELVARIKRDLGLEAMAHLTCADATREELVAILERLRADGVENVLALRGDPPPPDKLRVPREQWLPHAADLAELARSMSFSVGGAAHPEVHPEATDAASDLAYLREKVQAGCAFLITNFFFTNELYFRFVERAAAAGVTAPIVAGIMPVSSVSGIRRMAQLNGAELPERLVARLERVDGDDKAVEEVGTEWALEQCHDLVRRGVPGIHFYTLNRSTATRRILSQLRLG